MTIQCSVVVPTYRRPDLLERCLSGLVHQSIPACDYEIIVADDAGDAETMRVVEQFSAQSVCRIVYVAVEGLHGPAAARNAGAAVASGQFLAFTDDDCCPWGQWLEYGLAVLGPSDADAAWGRLLMPLPEYPSDYERDAAGLATAVFVTANCFCRKSSFIAIGGFDMRFAVAWREDTDLYFTLLELGYEIVQAPLALVTHPIRPGKWGISISQQRKSKYDVLLARKHPQLYRQLIPPFPRIYVAASIAIGLVVSGVILKQLSIAWLGFAVWTFSTGYFCGRRLNGTSRHPGHIAEIIVTSVVIPPLSLFWRFVGLWQFRSVSSPARLDPIAA